MLPARSFSTFYVMLYSHKMCVTRVISSLTVVNEAHIAWHACTDAHQLMIEYEYLSTLRPHSE